MKKSLLLSGLLLISSVANASGLYVSLGYSNADPEFEQRGYALDSTDSFYDNLGFNLSDKWPSSTSYPRYEDWAASSNLKQEVSAEYNNGIKLAYEDPYADDEWVCIAFVYDAETENNPETIDTYFNKFFNVVKNFESKVEKEL